MSKVKQAKKRHEALKIEKQWHYPEWDKASVYVANSGRTFSSKNYDSKMLLEGIFDAHPIKSNERLASSLMGMLWQSGAKSMRIEPVKEIADSNEVKDYFEQANEITQREFDAPEARLTTTLQEYFLEQGAFGTSGIGVFEGDQSALSFQHWGLRDVVIDEGRNGFVDTIFAEFEWTVKKIVDTYGQDKVSEKIRELYKASKFDDKAMIVMAIQPRSHAERKNAKGNRAMAYSSLHFEQDSEHLLKESGFHSIPVMVSRFEKYSQSKYGRGPGLNALADIMMLNAIVEAMIVAIEKKLSPALGVLHEDILGGSAIDTSAGAMNVLNTLAGQSGGNPVFPLFDVGELQSTQFLIEKLTTSISEHFHIDRLLDFNNDTQMTLGEVQIRNTYRNQSLGSIFARQEAELFTPMIERGVGILLRRGYLGTIPGYAVGRGEIKEVPRAILDLASQGKDFYKVKYFNPASRLKKAEEAQGIQQAYEFGGQLAQVDPGVLDNFDHDESVRVIADIAGAPKAIIRDKKEVEQIRAKRNQDMTENKELEKAKVAAETAKTAQEAENLGDAV